MSNGTWTDQENDLIVADFEAGCVAATPPFVQYSGEFQAQAAEELAVLPDGSAVVGMMGDCAVMRGRAWAWL